MKNSYRSLIKKVKDRSSLFGIYCNTTWMVMTLLLLTSSTSIIKPDPLSIYHKVANRLTALKTIKYHYIREFDYPAQNYIAKSEGDIYIDFAINNDLAGFRYQYLYAGGFSVFNNSEIFTADSKTKTIQVTHKVKLSNLEGKSALYNSIPTLRNILSLIIKDERIFKTASDTVINNKTYHLLQFVLQNKTINYTGTGFQPTTLDLTFNYTLIVDKTTLLPITLLQIKKGSEDLNRTDFTEIDQQPVQPSEKSWYYSSYFNEYELDKSKPVAIIVPGQNAPEWELTNYSSNVKETLKQYKGKVILIEFWIRNCGYCIAAVPELNQLAEKYDTDKFTVLALNTEDSRENIGLFANKNQVKYTIMYGDNPEVNKNYGIAAFPQVVLLDKEGKIIYSGGLDVKKITPLIEENI